MTTFLLVKEMALVYEGLVETKEIVSGVLIQLESVEINLGCQ